MFAPKVDLNSQRCRKSEDPEIGTGSKVGNRNSKIFFGNWSAEGKNVGNRKSELSGIGTGSKIGNPTSGPNAI
ncbi:unnamed protein product [Meloidogyne enterolobii]|uniref:Uncharacterized protein n=1 Tax=Meloidogyne enterolobii TaxID=390850 RepID=A0ACB1ASY2_MELEN